MISDRALQILEQIREIEGGYVDHPDDPGGATNHGVTERQARRHGWTGDMRDIPWEWARDNVYVPTYIQQPKFDQVGVLSWTIAEELIDTGINMGVGDAGTFLQQALNVLNKQASFYADIAVDGIVGDKTLDALEAYLERRGTNGKAVLLKALNCLQGAEYIRLAEGDAQYESFTYGWLRTRVEMAA